MATLTRPNLASRHGFAWPTARPRLVRRARRGPERPLWQQVVLLYTGLTLVVSLVISLSFLVAWIATGKAY
jgi:hypothetical protein